jgi:hypothetical protein
LELATELRIRPAYAMGHLHSLWHAALEQQEGGDLSSWSDEFIALSADFPGDAPQFVRLLQKHNWLEGKLLHDWLDYAGKYLTAKYRTANPKKLRQILLKHKSVNSRFKVGRSPKRLSSHEVPIGKEGESLRGEEKPPWPSPAKLVKLYNDLTPDECPEVTILSPARESKAKQYLAAFPKQDFWEQVFRRVHESKFLRGVQASKKNGREPFRFDFDWMLTKGQDGSENCIKTFEGKYADER